MKLELARRGPFDNLSLPSAPGCEIRALPPAWKYIFRGAPTTVFGFALPERPLTSTREGPRAALWLAPDEWLLIAEESEPQLGELSKALVDVSNRQATLEISGERAAQILNFGVALDLEEFAVGRVVRTVFLKADITLWKVGPELWRLEIARSFAAYLVEALNAALDTMRR